MNGSDAFLAAIDRKAKMFSRGARTAVAENPELCSWLLDPLARWAQSAYGERAFDDAASGYAKYCLGVAQAQQIYERLGQYTPEAMPDIVSAVYEDESYMVPYMWGAILIYAFWPSMTSHIAMFRDDFLRRLPAGASVLELASGHGVLSLLAAEERPDIRVEGVDISPPAVSVAERLLGVSGHRARVSYVVRDAMRSEDLEGERRYQGIISAMLAEHLTSPRSLFSAVGRRVSRNGLVFFSTAIESAQRDHVHEFHYESEPLRMAEEAGLFATRMSSGSSTTASGARFLPRATAMILRVR